jgi:hypothetical protein
VCLSKPEDACLLQNFSFFCKLLICKVFIVQAPGQVVGTFMQHLTAAYEIKSSNEAVTQEVDTIVEKTLKSSLFNPRPAAVWATN